MTKLTEIQIKAARHIADVNANGHGAIMPYAELIIAANQLEYHGLAERLPPSDRRWLTDAGRAALAEQEGT